MVGKVNLMDIYPMDFEEFLAATAFKRYIKENSPELTVRYSLLPYKEQENMVNIPLYYVGKIKIR